MKSKGKEEKKGNKAERRSGRKVDRRRDGWSRVFSHASAVPNLSTLASSSGKRKAHKHNFFVRLVLGRHQVCPGDFTGCVPGTHSVKTWDKPGFSPYFTQWKPGKPGTNPGLSKGQRAAQRVYVKKVYVPFSLAEFHPPGNRPSGWHSYIL